MLVLNTATRGIFRSVQFIVMHSQNLKHDDNKKKKTPKTSYAAPVIMENAQTGVINKYLRIPGCVRTGIVYEKLYLFSSFLNSSHSVFTAS